MERFAWVCLAGGVGTGARYLLTLALARRFGDVLPLGTFVVNVVGCFAIALVSTLALERAALSPEMRVVLTTGFLGGLTTYSSFSYETMRFVRSGAFGHAAAYFVATTLVCFAAVALGAWMARPASL